jgi:hypothetical protein
VVGDRTEHQAEGQLREVGADAVVRACAAKTDVRVGISQNVEAERVREDVLVEVGRAVEHYDPLPVLICTPESSVSSSAVR